MGNTIELVRASDAALKSGMMRGVEAGYRRLEEILASLGV
jgi:hypothetical protein